MATSINGRTNLKPWVPLCTQISPLQQLDNRASTNWLLNDEHKDRIEEVDGARLSGTYPDESYAFSSPSRVATRGTNGKLSPGKPSPTKAHHMTPFGQRTNTFVLQFEFNLPKAKMV
ncbi:uncharacterized protein LOC116251423 [Nymphaea colorata]|uniref:uncharacterized protein LOC116251423 n=1 Tax=Nymphaea colorata TaxID=210225 RepID=UPI00129E81B9|nr:uncharacterized protein LOC116251423 [Nymphaea colorata]